jgi:hypothetical protein
VPSVSTGTVAFKNLIAVLLRGEAAGAAHARAAAAVGWKEPQQRRRGGSARARRIDGYGSRKT